MTSNKIEAYAYDSLPQGRYIRVLQLEAGDIDAQLSGSLQPIELSQKSVQPYTAISYVWGSDARCAALTLNNHSLLITASAEEVLRRTRHPNKAVVLWIDGICINQDDINERELQVSFMHQVYARAASTFVWLGPAADDSDIAMQYIATLDAEVYNMEQRGSRNRYVMNKKTFILDTIQDLNSEVRLLTSSGALLARRWFSRVWIQQEVSASVNAVVACGRHEVSFDQLAALAWLFKEKWSVPWPSWVKIESFEQHRDLILRLQSMRRALESSLPGLPLDGFIDRSGSSWEMLSETEQHVFAAFSKQNRSDIRPPTRVELSYLLATSISASATDPRDKIYALLNMCSEQIYSIKPDYRISWQNLYVRVAREILLNASQKRGPQDTALLLFGGLMNNGDTFDLPSWVPNWQRCNAASLTWHAEWFPGGRGHPRFKSEQLHKKQRFALKRQLSPNNERSCFNHAATAWSMQTVVRFMDHITIISDWGIDLDTDEHYSAFAPRLLELDQHAMQIATSGREDHYLTGQTFEDAYAHVLIAGTGTQSEPVNNVSMLPALQAWRTWLANGCPGDRPDYMGCMESSWVFRENKVALSKHNLMCLVPKIAREGDIVAVIHSVPYPLVLRPVLDQYFVIVGECYIHGMMENQAGLLIDEYNIKVKPDKTRSWRPEGDIRRNGLATPAQVCHGEWLEDDNGLRDISIAKYKALVDVVGDQWITLV